jgi:two-component system, NtrC family, response regulator GlrR
MSGRTLPEVPFWSPRPLAARLRGLDPAESAASERTTRSLFADPESRARATLARFRLVVSRGPSVGASFSSVSERTVIGTHASADWVLEDDTVSRFHCEIVATGEGFQIRDLQSRNGTLVDNVSIQSADLRSSAIVKVGATELRFELRSDLARVEVSEEEHFGGLVGRSLSMRRVFSQLERAAESSVTVLLTGETGTGKDLVAEALHQRSGRNSGPFVVIDCSSVPAELLESELFGHEKGAFTGAMTARIGAFEEASGGTVFLDEVGELPADLQPKLLRALESRAIKPVGKNQQVPIDVRVIAATNRSLREEVNAKRFRSDLYYRLAVIEIQLPPLRERREDIPLLLEHLLQGFVPTYGELRSLRTPEFLAELARHHWPGNVRELRNFIERCLALREIELPRASEGPASDRLPDYDLPLKQARERWTRALERRYVEELLSRHERNVAAAARAAGVDRAYFYRLVWRYGLA